MDGPPDPLVLTKLRPSQARADLVARPRLIARLDRAPGRRLTLLCAPAGFGKSTVLGAWAQRRAGDGNPVAWVSLDRADNDPARFLAYVVSALRRSGAATFGERILAALRSTAPPRPEALTASLINELAAQQREIALVLDDYHLIDAASIHRVVRLLLEHLPAGLHLIVASRTRPPLALARLRARGQLAELTASDLAFTQDESETFLREVMNLDLSIENVATLAATTEGWIAGLQLAALSMRDRHDPAGFIASFSGKHRSIFDFLAEEVLDRQAPAVREFLLATSVLDRLAGPLCEAVTGQPDGQEMLEHLERDNLFIVALDDERRWFRYHHLFGEFLRGHLGSKDPARVRELHLRAARWHEEHGHGAEAIRHALAAPDHELGTRLIAGEVMSAWSRGEVPTILGWLDALPIELKRRKPSLLLQQAMALALTGRPQEVEPLLTAAEGAVETEAETRQFRLGFAAAVRSWCARLRGDAESAVGLARKALSLLPADVGGLRTFAGTCLGDALWTTGDLVAAGDALAEASASGRRSGHVYATISAMTLLARVQVERGQLGRARETLDRARQVVADHHAELLPAAGAIHIGMGALHYEHNRLERAETALGKGVELADGTRNVTDLVWGTVLLSRTRWAQGDKTGSLDLARKAERTARRYGADLEIALATAWLTRLHIARGDLTEAAAAERARTSMADDAATAARVLDRIASARLLHAVGRHGEALRLLDAPLREAQAHGRTHDLIEIMALSAQALWASHEPARAERTLASALALAAPEGYVRIFVDEGPPMATLLSALLDAERDREPGTPHVETDYARRLLAALRRDVIDEKSASTAARELLTQREAEVLELIISGMSNREIAAQLYVSLGTVKTHINNVYRKLGVHSRRQVVARVREWTPKAAEPA